MKKLLFALFALLLTGTISLSAQQTRDVAPVKPAAYFQTRMERLYKAIPANDQTAIARYERDLTGAMRQAIEDAKIATPGSTQARFKKDMEAILTQFENFTFVNAAKDASDAHLGLLESFLAMMQ